MESRAEGLGAWNGQVPPPQVLFVVYKEMGKSDKVSKQAIEREKSY